jgi:hypothetical protein
MVVRNLESVDTELRYAEFDYLKPNRNPGDKCWDFQHWRFLEPCTVVKYFPDKKVKW